MRTVFPERSIREGGGLQGGHKARGHSGGSRTIMFTKDDGKTLINCHSHNVFVYVMNGMNGKIFKNSRK